MGAQGQRQRRDERDHQEQRSGERVLPGKPCDQEAGRRGDDVVEHDQPRAAVAVQQRAGDRRDDKTGCDRKECGQARELRRLIAGEHEQDEGDRDHLPTDAPHDQARVEIREPWDAHERGVAGRAFGF